MALPSHTSDQGMAELCESPLAHAVTCHLEIKYPNLQEYKSLILAEIVELSLTTAGVQSLAHDPNAFVEKAVKRAMVCLAQVRVALRQAVRDELQAKEETRTSPAATPAVKAQQEQP